MVQMGFWWTYLVILLMTMGMIAVTGQYIHTYLSASVYSAINQPFISLIPVALESLLAMILFFKATRQAGKSITAENGGIIILVLITVMFLYSVLPGAFPAAFSIFGH